MSRNLLDSAKAFLSNNTNVRIAHLVSLDIPTTDVNGDPDITKFYLTDYLGDIVYSGKTYQAGKITKVGDIRQAQGLKNYKLSIDVAGEYPEELARGLVENLDFSYVGKQVEVLRAYLDDQGGIVPFDSTTNGPMQYFIGDISEVNIQEGVTSGVSKVTWQCAGKFADFDKVNGRITDDEAHRGIVVNANGDKIPSAGAKVAAHQTDTGFQHAAQSINLVTKYTTTEKRYKMKKRKFWQSPKLVEYDEEVEKTLELGVDLSATFLPKIYGVRRTPGIPVFIDALKSSPNTVYVVYAFCEGEVDGFLDLYIDGEPLICSSAAYKDSKLCLGNQAAGDTMSAFMSEDAAIEYNDLVQAQLGERINPSEEIPGSVYIDPMPPVVGAARTEGTKHTKDPITGEELISHFTVTNSTGNKEIWVHHGLPNQNANQDLVDIAAAGNFLNQSTWALDNPGKSPNEYWDQNCKLLDTAYIVVKFGINEEETAVPEIEAVVSGSLVDVYDSNMVATSNQYTLNPVWHLLDYMTSSMYGGGLSISDIDIESFVDVAAQLDTVTSSYEDNFLTYWRYVGWKIKPGDPGSTQQRAVMQCNTMLNTESTVTKNSESLLAQFDGTLNILGGKYHLSIENDADTIADIVIEDVIGSVKTKDLSNKGKWNSIQASIIDPGAGWNTTQISFFNSAFLEKDNGVQKKGNVGFAHITNYYTAREKAERELKKSRFSRQITITTYHKYLHLFPNANVTFQYDRFWNGPKKFRVVDMNLRTDSTVTLTLEDYDSSIYSASDSPDNSGEVDVGSVPVGAPVNLKYTRLPNASFSIPQSEDVQGILTWEGPLVATSIERFDVLVMTGTNVEAAYTTPTSMVVLEDNDPNKPRYYFPVVGLLSNTDYLLKVRTINSSGKGSRYVTVGVTTVTHEPPLKLSPPTMFVVDNRIEGLKFVGPDLLLSWTESTSIDALQYEITVMTGNGSELRTDIVPQTNNYVYTLSKNKIDYNNLNVGLGAYRTLTAKIRATNGEDPNGGNFSSSDWVFLT